MRWSDILTDNSTFFLSHDKKDSFAVHGKSALDERFLLLRVYSPPFA